MRFKSLGEDVTLTLSLTDSGAFECLMKMFKKDLDDPEGELLDIDVIREHTTSELHRRTK